MSIRRARLPFEGQYVQIPNAWMRDNRLTHRARGLLAEIMTHADGWVISQSMLWRHAPEGREAIRKMVAELVAAGYLAVDQERGELGRFGEVNYVLTAPELAEVTATQKLGNGSLSVARSTAPQESATKNTIGKNTKGKKGADAPPTPDSPVDNPAGPPARTCKRHPANSDEPCRNCQIDREALLRWELTLVAGSRDDQWVPTPMKPSKAWKPGLCIPHLQIVGNCDMCRAEGIA